MSQRHHYAFDATQHGLPIMVKITARARGTHQIDAWCVSFISATTTNYRVSLCVEDDLSNHQRRLLFVDLVLLDGFHLLSNITSSKFTPCHVWHNSAALDFRG